MKVDGTEVIRDWRQALHALENDPLVAVDLETGGLRPHADPIAVVSMYGANSSTLAVLHVRGNVPAEVKDFLGRRDKEFIYHNGVAFDIPFLMAAGVRATRPKIFDTLVGAGVVITTNRAGQSKSLKAEINRRLGEYISKDSDHSRWMDPQLTDHQIAYCAEDIIHLPALRHEQIEKAKAKGQYSALMMEMDIVPVVSTMTHNGLPISISALRKSHETQQELLDTLGAQFKNRFGGVNVRSSKQVQKLFSDMGMIIPLARNAKGEMRPSVGAKVLENLLAKDDENNNEFLPEESGIRLIGKNLLEDMELYPERVNMIRAKDIAATINDLLQLREAEKRLGDYDDEWLQKFVWKGRVHSRFWQVGTDTIRFSSTDPNFQQWPQDFRKVIGGLEGHSIVSCDYSQLEAVIAAWMAQDKDMIDLIETGFDLHTLIAAQIFNKPVSSISKKSKERQVAKACSFCLLFGGGGATLQDYALRFGAVLSLEEAKDIVTRFFRQFRGLANDRSMAYDTARQGKGSVVEIRLANGTIRHLVGNKVLPTTILNTRVQGNAAVGMKYALLECKKMGLHKYLGATVHDELVSCVPDDIAQDYAEALKDCMLRGMANIVGCTVRAEANVGPVWTK